MTTTSPTATAATTPPALLVTGASGFIGSFVVEEGLRRGMTVWAAVRATSSRRYLRDGRIRFIELDLNDTEKLEDRLRRHVAEHGAWQAVVHAAGATKCRRADDFFRINADGTNRLARALMRTGALSGRFVFISSLSIFGPIHETDYAPITATDVPRPNTAYGASKLAAEHLLSDVDGLDYVVLRPTGVYGPRERDYFLMAKSIRRGVDFAVGHRRQVITFIYVRDLVAAIFLALKSGRRGGAYFLTDGGEYSSRTFSDLLRRDLGVRRMVRLTAPLWLLRTVCLFAGTWARMLGHTSTLNADKYNILSQRNWRCDIAPACTDLGYRPAYPLERGVAETIAWYKEKKWL